MLNQQPEAQEQRGFWRAVREEVARLEFLSRFFTWFFMLLSRLSEPLMTLSAIYIAVEAGLPAIAVAALHDSTVAVMIAAPEIILPGSFAMAAQAKSEGKPYKLLYAVSWCFVALTGVTLLSLFVFHLDGSTWNMITFLRCGAGVGYSILIRVLTHGHQQEPPVPVADVLANFTELTEQLQRLEANTAARIAAMEWQITNTLQAQSSQSDVSLLLAQVVEQLDAHYTQRMETMLERTVERVNVSIVQQREHARHWTPASRQHERSTNGRPEQVNTLGAGGERKALPVNTTLDALDSDIGQRIRTSLLEDSTLSARALAVRVGCSPTTASKWKSRIEAEIQAQ
jgi:hypothetical protein